MRRTMIFVSALALMLTALVVPAAADHPNEPLGTPLVTPQTFGGNDSCSETRINNPETGTYVFEVDGFTFEVDIVTDGTYFSFDANAPVQQVIAKGGPNYNVYDYSAENLVVTHDSGLHSPINPKTGRPYGLSHISFCFDEPIRPEGTLDVSKTAAGTFDREVSWALTKTVVPASHSGGPGDTFSSDWRVVATKTDSGAKNFAVTGEIEVSWAGTFPVSVQVVDTLNDETVADVDCSPDTETEDGTDVIDFGAETKTVTCTYVANPADASATTNFVELEVLGEPAGDVTGNLDAEAPVVWTENLTGDDEVQLTDDRKPHSGPIDASTTLDYTEVFECPAMESGRYVDGLYTETFPNTATLTGPTTNESASAVVTLTCRIVFQGETVTGAGDNWSNVGSKKTSTNNWFQYTVGTSGTFDLVQGRQLNDVGDVTIIDNEDGTTTLCFSFDDPWQLDPTASGNVKIEPLDEKPKAYLSPGQFTYHFTEPSELGESGSDFCVTVESGSYGYAIHLDAGFWTSG